MNEKKEPIFKNRKIILISILVLSILIICSSLIIFIKNAPSREAKKYFDLLTNKEYGLSQNYLNSEINYFTASVLNEENLNEMNKLNMPIEWVYKEYQLLDEIINGEDIEVNKGVKSIINDYVNGLLYKEFNKFEMDWE